MKSGCRRPWPGCSHVTFPSPFPPESSHLPPLEGGYLVINVICDLRSKTRVRSSPGGGLSGRDRWAGAKAISKLSFHLPFPPPSRAARPASLLCLAVGCRVRVGRLARSPTLVGSKRHRTQSPGVSQPTQVSFGVTPLKGIC